MQDNVKNILRPLARPILSLFDRMSLCWALRKGWRPPYSAPIEDYMRAPFGYEDEAEIRKAVPLVSPPYYDVFRAARDTLVAGAIP